MNRDNAYCYVLSGGGAKGVYHIGVWKALKELGIRVEAFVGNSIGAILGEFLAQGLDAELEEIGSSKGFFTWQPHTPVNRLNYNTAPPRSCKKNENQNPRISTFQPKN